MRFPASLLAALALSGICFQQAHTGQDARNENEWAESHPVFGEARVSVFGAKVLAAMHKLQKAKLQPEKLSGKRVLICKTFGGMGNRIQGVTSCLAFALATNRALVLDWHLEYDDINGLMPCRINDLFQLPSDLNVNVSTLQAGLSEEEVQRSTMEVYRSQVKMGSGETPNWAELLLCRNLSLSLEPVPILLLPAFRWMPETVANAKYRDKLQRLLADSDSDSDSGAGAGSGRSAASSASFYRSVAPSFFQPTPDIAFVIRELGRYWPATAKRMGMHLRVGQATDDPRQIGHFFTPAELWPAWVQCGYAAMPHAWRLGSAPVVWFLATDTHLMKANVVRQLERSEGKIVKGLNLDLVLESNDASHPLARGIERIDALQHTWPHLQPVVAEFASGSRLVMLAQATSREACGNLQGALVEMEVLGRSELLVASHLSTFASFSAATLLPGALHHVTRDGDCFPASTMDPLSDTGDLYNDDTLPSCYSDKTYYELSWARPRLLSVRSGQP